MAYDQDPYQAYTDGSLFSDNPFDLVIALYQGALDSTHQAESAFRAGDVAARGAAINKGISILTELLVSLNLEKGGEIGRNLKRLYSYMQAQLLKAHVQREVEPVIEVRKLLETLLEGWRGAEKAQTYQPVYRTPAAESAPLKQSAASAYGQMPIYSGYGEEMAGAVAGSAYSF